jgi:hypothetical protein
MATVQYGVQVMRVLFSLQVGLLVLSFTVALLGGPRIRRMVVGLNVAVLLLLLAYTMIVWVEA